MTSLALTWGAKRDPNPWQSRDWCIENDRPEVVYNVVQDPQIWGGVAIVANTRIPVFMIEDFFSETGSVDEVINAYPRLTVADVYYALAYASAYSGMVAQDREAHERAVEKALRG